VFNRGNFEILLPRALEFYKLHFAQ
jgi:hypothetical protein